MIKKQKKESTGKGFQKEGRAYPEAVRRKIVSEIHSRSLSQRAAERQFNINRKTLDCWITKYSLLPLKPEALSTTGMGNPNSNKQVNLLNKQVRELQKALEKARLKIDGLETLIQVSEEELKIKIRKKPGAKQSKK